MRPTVARWAWPCDPSAGSDDGRVGALPPATETDAGMDAIPRQPTQRTRNAHHRSRCVVCNFRHARRPRCVRMGYRAAGHLRRSIARVVTLHPRHAPSIYGLCRGPRLPHRGRRIGATPPRPVQPLRQEPYPRTNGRMGKSSRRLGLRDGRRDQPDRRGRTLY